ncbi:Rossmann-like domain-containing protein [Actinoplanes sp. NPDC049265]|uniref:Rossmann-like domain-containing protein n=1 Tax=Actinoplanes sp. NPDC049265 TaxID=3363902 RepID=UPI0037193009
MISVDSIIREAIDDPGDPRVSVAFVTRQGARHAGRGRGYRNHVLSLRVEAAVGSCAIEPGALPDDLVYDCVGVPVKDLLSHETLPVRVAALDAYLMSRAPHAGVAVTVAGGTSLAKSRQRAEAVAGLLPEPRGRTVLVVGVVNSLLASLRERGWRYLPCDLAGGTTEWGEPCLPDAAALLDRSDAILASGMTLGNGTFEPLLAHAAATGKPFVAFAQTGSAILPRFVGAGLSAVSAEPYPFFWLDGGPTTIFRYAAADAPPWRSPSGEPPSPTAPVSSPASEAFDGPAVGGPAVGGSAVGGRVVGRCAVDGSVVGGRVVGRCAVDGSVVGGCVVGRCAVDGSVVGGRVVGRCAVDESAVGGRVVGGSAVGRPAIGRRAVDEPAVDGSVLDRLAIERAAIGWSA